MAHILIKTTIPPGGEDWHADRFSLLRAHLESLRGADGAPLHQVSARDREADAAGDDLDLAGLGDSDIDQLWLFAVDVNNAITARDARGVHDFRRRGGGLFMTRDHQDLGKSLLTLGKIGTLNCFQTGNPEPDETRRHIDDTGTPAISWPNYNSGRNGDHQQVQALAPDHPLAHGPGGGTIRFLPAHPHEGAVIAPDAYAGLATVVLGGRSVVSGRPFNIAVAVEGERDDDGTPLGRVVAQSTFHHFADYNWDTGLGCPSFVSEAPGRTLKDTPQAMVDTHAYVANLADWLAGGAAEQPTRQLGHCAAADFSE